MPIPGTNASHSPEGLWRNITLASAFQPLKFPTTETRVAFGAQTRKFTPSTPSTVRRWAPSLL